ncbi:MAG: FAD/FMN-containing dehydrogenase, partial [Myxococcota bacterium]
MIPRLTELEPTQSAFVAYLDALARSAFTGDIRRDAATRLVTATDNSVYQIMPQAVVFPRSSDDVQTLFVLATRPEFSQVTFTPRGGGTGTNGQSLTEGIVVDVSRHMNQILEVDLENGSVRVQPGVVLDQLNDALRPEGVFFAPNLSPSSRATIGGMIATDACGKGSRIYGKTSEHLRSLEMVFVDGTRFTSTAVDAGGLNALCERDDVVGHVHRTIHTGVITHRDTIERSWPKLRRFMTGYNLARVHDSDTGAFNLPMLIAGSEGSLAVVTEATLRLTPIPAHRELVVLKFASFEDALASAGEVVAADPGAIETIDERVLSLAREDVIYHQVRDYLTDTPHGPTRAINLVEFEGPELSAVRAKVTALIAGIDAGAGTPHRAIGYHLAPDAAARSALWTLRKKGVGLLGNTKGSRKPIAFIEDTVVPPEHLPAYVAELRAMLDAEGVVYGMFGHVDVGCLHVRPALDMKDPEDVDRLRRISDKTATLVRGYGGLIWGEHGKGMRAEYSPVFFGETLFGVCCDIKGAADPANRLSPGKVATPPNARNTLVTIDAPTRGAQDRQIPAVVQEAFQVAIDCNGNGQCFDYAADHMMCPSSKITRDRIHSPKGRAGVMREWLRQLATAGYDPVRTLPWGRWKQVASWPVRAFHTVSRRFGRYDYSTEVYDAMAGCLACKACATQCPVKVDVPSFRARFFDLYHRRYLRPLK